LGHSVRLLVAIVAALALLLTATHVVQIRLDRGQTEREARAHLRDIAAALAQHTEQTLGSIDKTLSRFAGEVGAHGPDFGGAPGVAHESLRAARDSAMSVREFFVADAAGRVAMASYAAAPEPVDLSREPPLAQGGAPPTGLRISPPIIGHLGQAKDQRVLRLAREARGADGGLRGWVVGTISIDHFRSLFGSLSLTPRTEISLFRDDGVILASSAAVDDASRIAREALFREHLQGRAEGSVWHRLAVDGERHLVVFLQVDGMPLALMAEQPESEVFAAWRVRSLTGSIITLVLVILMIGAAAVAIRALRLRQREQEDVNARLNRLATVSVELGALRRVDDMLQRAAEAARELVPCHQSVVSLTTDARFAQAVHTVSLSDKYAGWRGYDEDSDGSGIYRLVCADNAPMRLTQAELEAHPAWRGFGAARDRHPPMRGWLAVPLIGQDGRNLGLMQLSDRYDGEFDERDEALLLQLARTVSISVENVRLLEARTAALRAAEEARDEMERVLSTMSDGVYHLDADWRFTYANRAAQEMYGVDVEALRGRAIWEVFPTLRTSEVWERFHQARSERLAVSFERREETTGRSYLLRAFPVEEGLSVYATDITQRVEAEQQLRQAQKMEAVGQLTGGVAHDFNNLLTVIMGNADLLIEESGDDARMRVVAEMIQAAAGRGADLTHRLLAFSRRQPLAPRVVDVNQLVIGLEGLLRRTLHEDIEVEMVRGAGLWRAVVDQAQLESALLNIAINARDAMPAGGKLTIETANVHLDDAYASLHDEVRAGQYVMIALSDTGEGMAPEVLARAFDPFFTTKPVGKGSGLGLSMVYGFAKQSGGHVKLYSEHGYGTAVKLYLPRASERQAAEESAAPGAAPVPTGHERIAVVEDEDLVRRFAEAALRDLGYEVTAFATGPDLLRAMEGGLTFDLLFTDIVLPGGMNGRRIAEEVTARLPAVKVLYSSGYTDNAIVHHGRLDEGVTLLNKPFRKAEMARKVRAVLDGQSG
jgi:PAS domain S-box-containing protein